MSDGESMIGFASEQWSTRSTAEAGRPWFISGASALAALVVFAPTVWHMTAVADFPEHIEVARQLFAGGSVPPHPGYHLAVAAVHAVARVADWRASAAIVTSIGVMALAAIIGRWVGEALADVRVALRYAAAVAVPLALLIVQPALPWPPGPRDPWLAGYVNVNQWHNPTTLFVRPFGLLLFELGLAALAGAGTSPLTIIGAGLLSLLSVLVKPNVVMTLLPAFGVAALLDVRRVRWSTAAAITLPAVLGLAAQYAYYFRGVHEASRVELRPLYVIGLASPTDAWTLAAKFLASILFPLVVMLCFRAARRDRWVRLAWGVFVVGAAQGYLLAEGNGHADSGNFMWSATIANGMLYAVTAVFLLRDVAARIRDSLRVGAIRVGLCGVVFAYQVLSGIVHLHRSWP